MKHVLALAFACVTGCGSDDDATPDAGAARRDGGLDGGFDAGARDGSTDAGSDAGLDAALADAGPCDGPEDCAGDRVCLAGACVDLTTYDCCAGDECPTGLVCNMSCRCAAPMGCCADPSECEIGATYCDDSCACAACDPPCDRDRVCVHGGSCEPRCFLDGCPGGEVCAPEGCIPAACSFESCLHMTPPLACDETSGCFDPCDDAIRTECAAMGANCVLGYCVDTTCGGSGEPRCTYRRDCCGNGFCLGPGDPDPPCPIVCFPPEPIPDERFCVCTPGGGCLDLADSGGF